MSIDAARRLATRYRFGQARLALDCPTCGNPLIGSRDWVECTDHHEAARRSLIRRGLL